MKISGWGSKHGQDAQVADWINVLDQLKRISRKCCSGMRNSLMEYQSASNVW